MFSVVNGQREYQKRWNNNSRFFAKTTADCYVRGCDARSDSEGDQPAERLAAERAAAAARTVERKRG